MVLFGSLQAIYIASIFKFHINFAKIFKLNVFFLTTEMFDVREEEGRVARLQTRNRGRMMTRYNRTHAIIVREHSRR